MAGKIKLDLRSLTIPDKVQFMRRLVILESLPPVRRVAELGS